MITLMKIGARALQILAGLVAGVLIAICVGGAVVSDSLLGLLYLIPISVVGAVYFWFVDKVDSWL